MYRVILHKSATKKIAKLPKDLRGRIFAAIDLLSVNPYAGKRLHGELEGSCRLRIGDFRIVYDVNENNKVVIIHAIGSRGDIYK